MPFFERVLRGERDLVAAHAVDLLGRTLGLIVGEGLARGVRGPFPQHPDGVAIRVPDDLTTRRIFAITRNAGGLHRLRVDEDTVAARVAQEYRVFWAHGAQAVMGGKSFDIRGRAAVPFVLVPASPDDPLARLHFGHGFFDHADDVVPVLRVAKVELDERGAVAHPVSVAFDEAGNRELAVEVDNSCVITDIGFDFLVGAECYNLVPAGRKRLGLRHGRVDGDDFPAQQNEVGGLGAVAAVAGASREGEDPNDANSLIFHGCRVYNTRGMLDTLRPSAILKATIMEIMNRQSFDIASIVIISGRCGPP